MASPRFAIVKPVACTRLEGSVRLGLISDTHGGIVDWAGVQPKVERLFEGVDQILHCGDVGTGDVLDALSTIAPVLALRGKDAPPADGTRLVEGSRVVECDGCRIGLTFSLGQEPVSASIEDGLSFPREPARRVGELLFDGHVDAVVFGGTHQSLVASADGTVFVNPGSPSLSDKTTVGIIRISHGVIEVEIIPVP